MFYMKVSIKDKRAERKVSIPLSLLLSLSNHKSFEGFHVSDEANSPPQERKVLLIPPRHV